MINALEFNYILSKYNIKVRREYFFNLPNMGSVELAALFCELGYTTGAEVGVFMGYFSEVLCKANPDLHLYSIDAWSTDVYEPGFLDQAHSEPGTTDQAYYDSLYAMAVERLAPYNCTLIRKWSVDASKDFADNSLDFVYLDAGHDFYNFTADLHHWKNKVRRGGILAGHDYSRFKSYKNIHVREALMAYAISYQMRPFFVLPRIRGKMRRDLYGSWFWVKQ